MGDEPISPKKNWPVRKNPVATTISFPENDDYIMKPFIAPATLILIVGLCIAGCTTTTQDLGSSEQSIAPTSSSSGSSPGTSPGSPPDSSSGSSLTPSSTAPSDTAPGFPDAGPEVTPLSTPLKFRKGDIIGDATTDTAGWIVLDTNPAAKEYKVDLIYRNDDGSWGWREFPVEEWTPQVYLEEGSSIVIATMNPANIRSNYPNEDAWMAGQGQQLTNDTPQ